MARFQFSLKYLLYLVVACAFALLLVRFAIQSHGAAVALLVVAIGALVLLIANIMIYGILRAVGMVFGMDSVPQADHPPVPISTTTDQTTT